MENTTINYEEEIKAAEARLAELKLAKQEKEDAEKALAKSNRKADVEVVKSAISDRLLTEIEAKKEKAKAYSEYLERCDAADQVVKEKSDVETAKLTEFCKKYGEGFHETITLGDITYRVDYETESTNYVDPFKRLFGWWF